MSAGTLALLAAVGAFLAIGVVLALALLPFIQHISAALPR